jgi:hypothetical protein
MNGFRPSRAQRLSFGSFSFFAVLFGVAFVLAWALSWLGLENDVTARVVGYAYAVGLLGSMLSSLAFVLFRAIDRHRARRRAN